MLTFTSSVKYSILEKKKKGNKSACILCITHANNNLILKTIGLENAKSMQVHQLLLSKNGMEEDFK